MMLADIANRAHDQIARNGGITINLQGHEPSEGYAFSPFPELEKVVPRTALTPELVHQYMHDNTHALTMPSHYLGAWHDQQSGNVFLDISKVGPAHADTVAEAAKAKQHAVFDLSNYHEIPTGVDRSRDVTSAWDFDTGHQIGHTPGKFSKGAVMPDGTVRTWNVNASEEPTHHEAAPGHLAAIDLNPDGTFHTYHQQPQQFEQKIMDATGYRPEGHEEWAGVFGRLNLPANDQAHSYTREGSNMTKGDISASWHLAWSDVEPMDYRFRGVNQLGAGHRCRFHPDREAWVNAGMADMCNECFAKYQQAILNTNKDMRTVHPDKLSWSLPDNFHSIGPQSLEEYALNQPTQKSVTQCPWCGYIGKMPLGTCPQCGGDVLEQRMASVHWSIAIPPEGSTVTVAVGPHAGKQGVVEAVSLSGQYVTLRTQQGMITVNGLHLGPVQQVTTPTRTMPWGNSWQTQRTKLSPKEIYRAAHAGWKIVEHHNESSHSGDTSRPFISDENTMTIHLGQPHGGHYDLGQSAGLPNHNFRSGVGQGLVSDGGGYMASPRVPSSVKAALLNHLGMPEQPPPSWGEVFGRVSDVVEGDEDDVVKEIGQKAYDELQFAGWDSETATLPELDAWEDEGGSVTQVSKELGQDSDTSERDTSSALPSSHPRAYTQAHAHEAGPNPALTPLAELAHVLGMDTWDASDWLYSETRPSLKEFLTHNGIRESSERPAERGKVFSTIPSDLGPETVGSHLYNLTLAILREGYRGGSGKGIVWPDGRVIAWNDDGFGRPHHMDVEHALRNAGDTAYPAWRIDINNGEVDGDEGFERFFPALERAGLKVKPMGWGDKFSRSPDGTNGWDSSKFSAYTYPSERPKIVDWQHLEDERDPNEEPWMHGTGDHPYFWDLHNNVVHVGPHDWYHDDLADGMEQTHGNPFQEGALRGGVETPKWGMGRSGMYRAVHAPVFHELENHGIHLPGNDWDNMFDEHMGKAATHLIVDNNEGESQVEYGMHTDDRPFAYSEANDTIYVGEHGGWHDDLYTKFPIPPHATHGRWDELRGTHELHGNAADEEHEAVSNALGTRPDDMTWEQKFAKETPGQKVRRWNTLQARYPDQSKVIHTTPQGWTIRHLPTYGDAGRTGLLMQNCWKGLASYSDPTREFDRYNAHHRYSLNDEHGMPQVAFFIKHPQHGRDTYEVQEALGARNKPPLPGHEQALMEWAKNNGYHYRQADYNNPLLEVGEDEDTDLAGHTFDAKVAMDLSAWDEIPQHGQQPDEDPHERPLIYDRQTGMIYVGHPGDSHTRVYDHINPQLGEGLRPWNDRYKALAVNPTTGAMNEYSDKLSPKEKIHVHGLIQHHMGVTPHEGEDWDQVFSKTADWDDPTGAYDGSETMTPSKPVQGHSLVWEPGWPGKGFYHNGELTTWGVSSNNRNQAWPHHIHMWSQRYPGTTVDDYKRAMNSGSSVFTIEPDGEVHNARLEGEVHPDVFKIDPNLRPAGQESWEDSFA